MNDLSITFVHRVNRNGDFESICLHCFELVATQLDEAELAAPEGNHVCSSWYRASFRAVGLDDEEVSV